MFKTSRVSYVDLKISKFSKLCTYYMYILFCDLVPLCIQRPIKMVKQTYLDDLLFI